MSGKIFHEPGLWNSCCFSLWCLGRYQGFIICAKILLQPGQGRDSLGCAGTWQNQDRVQPCHREQDVPGPASVLAQAGAVLLGGIHHRGSCGCKYRLGQCEIVMAIRSCQDTSEALCSSLGMLGSLTHGGGCVRAAALLDKSCLTQNLSFWKLQLLLI